MITRLLTSLRADLNRERAYCRSMRVNIEKGFNVSYGTKVYSGIRWQNAVRIKKAIKDLKNVKPVYKWLKP